VSSGEKQQRRPLGRVVATLRLGCEAPISHSLSLSHERRQGEEETEEVEEEEEEEEEVSAEAISSIRASLSNGTALLFLPSTFHLVVDVGTKMSWIGG